MKKVKASLGICAITLMAAGVMLGSAGADDAARVQLCQVETGRVEQVLAISGVLRKEVEYAAMAPSTGVVAQVYVAPGDLVAAGQPLFRLADDVQVMAVSTALESRASWPENVGQGLGQTQLREAAAQLESLTVRAAADGVVEQVNVVEHGGVLAGTAAVVLSGGGQEVQCSVVLRDAQELQCGMQARILRDEEIITKAEVVRIGGAEVSTTTGQTVCQVSLKPRDAIDLPLGATLEVEVILYGQEGVPVLPVQAVAPEGAVWWVTEGRSYLTPVETLMADEVNCWVNLPEGTVVVCGGEEPGQGRRVEAMKE